MLDYSDKRKRYAGQNPANFTPGTPRHDNPQKVREGVAYLRPAIRTSKPSEAFRVTTAPPPPAPPEPPPPAPYVEPVPANWEFDDTKGTTADKDKMGDL